MPAQAKKQTTPRKSGSAKGKKTPAKGSAAKKAPAKKAKKPPTRKGPARKATAKKAAPKRTGKRAAGRPAAKKKAPAKANRKVADQTTGDEDSTLIDIEVLAEVDSLVADEPKLKKSRAKVKPRGPKTPTVPRTVKPAPKIAELEMDPEILAFIAAIDQYKHDYSRPFPTWSEIYFIMKQLGYRND